MKFFYYTFFFFLLAFSINAQTNLTEYPNNPVITYGAPGEWDIGVIYHPEVVYDNGFFFLFYSGSSDILATPFKTGCAISGDGFTWSKYPGNPIFEADGNGFDSVQVAEARLIKEGNIWVMYYNASPGTGPGPAIGRATSDSLTGSWSRLDDPVLTAGTSGEWDEAFVTPNAILSVDSGYFMYYSGGTGFPFPPNNHAMVGLAFSSDGMNWTKYDDPATTSHPYAESDPVLKLGPGNYDLGLAWECDVLKTADGFEMFYTSCPSDWTINKICYAKSDDGILWNKFYKNPILMGLQIWETAILSPSAIIINDQYFVYYTGALTATSGQIGLATSPIIGIENSTGTAVNDFRLFQSYPNPFNPSTKIKYSVPINSNVQIKVYDVLGNEIKTLVIEEKSAGSYEITWNAANLPSGVYFYQLKATPNGGQAVDFIETRKMILMK